MSQQQGSLRTRRSILDLRQLAAETLGRKPHVTVDERVLNEGQDYSEQDGLIHGNSEIINMGDIGWEDSKKAKPRRRSLFGIDCPLVSR